MGNKLTTQLVKEFAAITNDNKKDTSESILYGEIVKNGDNVYVKLDGSDISTPVDSSTTEVLDGDRVSVMIKDHTAVVTGNFTKPATNEEAVDDKITEFSREIEDELSGYSSRISQNTTNINLAIRKADAAKDSADAAQDTADTASESAYNAIQLLGAKVDKGDVVTEVNLSTDGVQIYGNRFEVYAENCAIDAQGNAVFYQAQFPGGIKLGDETKVTDYGSWTDKYGNVHPMYICGDASSPIYIYKDGARIMYRASGSYLAQTVASEAYVDLQTQGLASKNYVDNKCSGFATTSDLATKSDVGHTHTAENVFSYGTAATQYWVTQNFEAKSSDIRLKKNIESMSVNRVRKFYQSLNPVSYNFKNNPSKKCFGLIAQDVLDKAEKNLYLHEQELDLVDKNTEISEEDKQIVGDDYYYTINYNQLHAFHIAMIQDLMKRVEELEKEVKELKEKE